MAGRHRRSAEPPPARGRWLAIGGAAVAVVVLAVVLPLVLLGNGGNGKPTAGDSPRPHPTPSSSPSTSAPPSSAAPGTTSSPASSASTTTSPAAARSTKPPPTLLVRADRAASWLIVKDGRGRIRFNALVPRGDTESFTGPFFHVTIGYPPGVVVMVNGQRQPRGGAAHVLNFDVRGR